MMVNCDLLDTRTGYVQMAMITTSDPICLAGLIRGYRKSAVEIKLPEVTLGRICHVVY